MLLEADRVPQALRVHIFRGLIGMVVGFAVGQVDGLLPTPTPAERANTSGRGHHRPAATAHPLLTGMRAELMATRPVDALRCNLQMLLHSVKARTADNSETPNVEPPS